MIFRFTAVFTPKQLMKNLLILCIAIVAFSSCRKKDDDCNCPTNNPTTTAATPANNYLKLQAGNYWVYDDYTIDTNAVETFTGTDSAYVSGDTVYNGNTYHMLFDLYGTTWLRDSSGFIVDTAGKVYFTNVVFNLPVAFNYYGGSIGYSEQMTLSTPVQVTVPAGTYSAYDWQLTAHFTDPNYQWGHTRYAHSYFSEGTGKVKQIFFFYSQSSHVERRLNHFHVQ